MKDLSVARAIADTVDVCPDLPLLEVGPGMSVPTQYLLTKGRSLKAPSIVDYRQSHEILSAFTFSTSREEAESILENSRER